MTNPNNPNPFIGTNPTDTLGRVSAGIVFLQDIEILRSVAVDADKESEANFSTSGTYGFYLLTEALRYAVEREAKVLSSGRTA